MNRTFLQYSQQMTDRQRIKLPTKSERTATSYQNDGAMAISNHILKAALQPTVLTVTQAKTSNLNRMEYPTFPNK